jgi:hypothetical protein
MPDGRSDAWLDPPGGSLRICAAGIDAAAGTKNEAASGFIEGLVARHTSSPLPMAHRSSQQRFTQLRCCFGNCDHNLSRL